MNTLRKILFKLVCFVVACCGVCFAGCVKNNSKVKLAVETCSAEERQVSQNIAIIENFDENITKYGALFARVEQGGENASLEERTTEGGEKSLQFEINTFENETPVSRSASSSSVLIENFGTVTGGSSLSSGGGIIGYCGGLEIKNAELNNSGLIKFGRYAGGIIGWVTSNVTIDTNAELTNKAKIYSERYAGGIIGYVGTGNSENPGSGTVTISDSSTEITNEGEIYGKFVSGGIIGEIYTRNLSISGAKIINDASICGATIGDDANYKSRYAGGIVGWLNTGNLIVDGAIIKNEKSVIASSTTEGYDNAAGGIIGYVGGTIEIKNGSELTNTSTNISASGRDTANYAGGIFGWVSESQDINIKGASTRIISFTIESSAIVKSYTIQQTNANYVANILNYNCPRFHRHGTYFDDGVVSRYNGHNIDSNYHKAITLSGYETVD